MELQVKFFARYRDEAGTSKTKIEVEGKTVQDAINEISKIYPKVINEIDNGKANLVINGNYSDLNSKIEDGDTLAIFPPVSGG